MLPQHLKTGAVVASCIGYVSAGFPLMGPRKTPAAAAVISTLHEQGTTTPHERLTSLQRNMARIQETFDTVSTMPSCKKLAAQDLLKSCESFENRRAGQIYTGFEALEFYQDLHAIRATNCDHLDALPTVCKPLLEVEHNGHAPRTIIKNCLDAMKNGQINQWTTYSGIKTQSLVMCHAMRSEADKDDSIYLHKVLAAAIGDINTALFLQTDELEGLTKGLSGISRQTREFQDALYRDNQDIKGEMKGFSVELKGSMAEIGEQAQVMLQKVGDFKNEFESAMELAKSRTDQADTRLVTQANIQRDALDLLQERYDFTIQQIMDDFHAYMLNVSQSVKIANDQTSILARKIEEVTVGLDAPLVKLAGLNSVTDELAFSVHSVHATSKETEKIMGEVNERAGDVLAFANIWYTWFGSIFSKVGSLGLYFLAIFPAALFYWALLVSCSWALVAAFVIAGYLSVVFAFVHSPVPFALAIAAHYPIIFSPAIWSVLTGAVVSISIWEIARMIYRYFCRTTNVDCYENGDMSGNV